MKMELPCEIVQDLLPGYIDGLTSDTGSQAVEGHLKGCVACEQMYQNMKRDYSKQTMYAIQNRAENEQEKLLFRKINTRLHKKVKATAIAGLVAIVAILALVPLLFNVATKEVPIDDVSVEASVYPIEELISKEGDTTLEESEAHSVVISKGETGETQDGIFSVTIPDLPEVQIKATQSVIQGSDYLTVLSWHSPYILNAIDWECESVGDEKIIKVTGFRTTFLKNRAPSGEYVTTSMEFDKVDKIVFVDENGSEQLLWEYEQ